MDSPADPKSCLLSIDAGTTHVKLGLFDLQGNTLRTASFLTPGKIDPKGFHYIPPELLWTGIVQAAQQLDLSGRPVAGIGIASAAESGLLIDKKDGHPLTPIFPWFDTSPTNQVEMLRQAGSESERFLAGGVYPSFKCSLAKILWARQDLGIGLGGAVWLSLADFIAHEMSGSLATDTSLAGRTYAYRIYDKQWDGEWLSRFGLSPSLFPTVLQAGTPAGHLLPGPASSLGLAPGIPVCIAGHDHICAALAVGAFNPGVVLDSIGTAEALVGEFPERILIEEDYRSGFSIGCHVVAGQFYWIGGLSTSGGSIEWLRNLVKEKGMNYADLESVLAMGSTEPGDILFFPYLAGAGSPHSDPNVRAAFVGMRLDHQLADLVKAVLEGTAYEIEFMRRQGEHLTGQPINHLVATGGGVRNRPWMQIKADVSGCRYELAQTSEAVLLGAAVIAGIGAGLYAGPNEAFTAVSRPSNDVFIPDLKRHTRYSQKFEQGFLRLQGPLREFNRKSA